MAIKVALLVITALIAVAAAHPYDPIAGTAAGLYCNDLAKYTTTIGSTVFEMYGCSKSEQLCVSGLPEQSCFSTPGQCYVYTWQVGEDEQWIAKICKNTWFPGYCYIEVTTKSCDNVAVQQQDDVTIEPPPEGVEICVEIDGEVVCDKLNEGEKANMNLAACFCVEDETSGVKLCVPDKCDASR